MLNVLIVIELVDPAVVALVVEGAGFFVLLDLEMPELLLLGPLVSDDGYIGGGRGMVVTVFLANIGLPRMDIL